LWGKPKVDRPTMRRFAQANFGPDAGNKATRTIGRHAGKGVPARVCLRARAKLVPDVDWFNVTAPLADPSAGDSRISAFCRMLNATRFFACIP
jgi:hypothetical protein